MKHSSSKVVKSEKTHKRKKKDLTIEEQIVAISELAETSPFEALQKLYKLKNSVEESFELLVLESELLLHPIVLEQFDDGAVDAARQALEKAIKLQPNKLASNYFNLASISEFDESMQLFAQGITVLEKELRKAVEMGEEKVVKRLKREMSKALLSKAETIQNYDHITPDLEKESQRCLETAIQIDPKDTVSLQGIASFQLSRSHSLMLDIADGNFPDPASRERARAEAEQLRTQAKQNIVESVIQWNKNLDENEDGEDTEDEDPSVSPPSITEQLQACQMLVDLHCSEHAMPVLRHLRDLDDQNFDVLFFQALGYSDIGKPRHAADCAAEALKLYMKEDPESKALIEKQLERFSDWKALCSMPKPTEDELDEESDFDDDEESEDEDDDEDESEDSSEDDENDMQNDEGKEKNGMDVEHGSMEVEE
ncbi:uncharacterized protein MONOS_5347 [Monocercomonoides exilis]|uniref:uncharacterized protein n=1 Tax=Monocercomonoides exilis TaxID=2049356 RepID=UPI00355A4FF4|nr:hypothetical protein MONOS_5347 [Monocercomonoides exilis]|eukprot:MONOS_5347.1-p1 / transcript=MONOS_5347.1 / gene=MONOS_5347 / organism=Monocercomonoides_exilis_PA203 / gene_product=unspecified product / transcript_product=unspecified product / location=Mono_scaffold00154:74786-76116(-) / protein_length=426 / sequence_SO=supercontig / SO=protein_coding / is_pseudo=false